MVVSCSYLADQPAFYFAVTGPQRSKAITNDFVFSGVLTSSNFGFHRLAHLIGPSDAEVLSAAHDVLPVPLHP